MVCFFIILSPIGNSQPRPADEFQLKSAFIFNFTRFIEWPSNSFADDNDPFIIGTLGSQGLVESLTELVKGEKFGNRQIVVRKFSSPKELFQCHIVFISSQDAPELRDLIHAMNRRRILTVSDAPNFAKLGGIVQFYKERNKLRLQINIDEVKASELIISSKLLSLSKIYHAN